MEFDLSVKNASTKEEYTDDTMLLPRGTRVIVQRLPAAKGHGLLSRIARDDFNGNNHVAYGNKTAAKNGFYEFTSREEDEEDEFEDAAADEMAALKAVTDQAMYNTTTSTSRQTTKPWTGTTGTSITVPPRGPSSNNNNKFHTHNHNKARPNADPELAKQERLLQQQQQPKKRPTGIPRTFLNSTSSNTTTAENNDTTKEEESALSRLQPIGFQALMGGKNSNNFNSNNTHDLEYALKVTSTIIPDHLQCAICKSVAKQAMLLPWDLEGHTTCESCIRDSLTQNGFVCPLTHQMGVSPDELLPNHGLRKAAELFIAQVMEDMDTVIQQQQRELKEQEEKIKKDIEDNVLEEETSSIVTKKSNKKLKQDEELGKENDLNGEDEFGGDVFDVAEEEKPPEEVKEEVEDTKVEIQKVIVKKEEPTIDDAPTNVPKPKDEDTEVKNTNETVPQKIPNFNNNNNNKFDSFPKQQQKQEKQSRGPPQGYMIGPATTNNENAHDNSNRRGGAHSRGGGRNYMGNRAGRGGGSNRNRGGAGRGHNNDNNNNRFTSESQQSKNHHHHYRPTGRTYLNSQQQHQQDQRVSQTNLQLFFHLSCFSREHFVFLSCAGRLYYIIAFFLEKIYNNISWFNDELVYFRGSIFLWRRTGLMNSQYVF